MDYICVKRFKSKALCGDVNIPYGTHLTREKNLLRDADGREICYFGSQNCLDYFARNDDGQGEARGKLTREIRRLLTEPDDQLRQERWERVWADGESNKLRQKEHEDYFLWDIGFYEADIPTLEHILSVVKEVTTDAPV